MNEKMIQRRLMLDRYRRSFVLPNFTPPEWFECDVFEITESGYFREYEIKLTLSDFRADAEKRRRKFNYQTQVQTDLVKHEMLRVGDVRGPTRFSYVAPKGLLTDIVPAWAGLIEVEPNRMIPVVAKPAPLLHRQKIDPKVRSYAEGICYWRLHDLLRNRQETLNCKSNEN